jgi:hypothetical protein
MRHRAVVACLVALVAYSASAQTYRVALPPGKRFVLPVASASPLLKQCSRAAPQGAANFWSPTEAHLDELESRLIPYLESRASAAWPPRDTGYHRQYIGFTKNGARYIYGNFYPWMEKIADSEKTQPVVICDGGPVFWGVVYDLDRGEFTQIAFNGFA